MRPRRSGAVFLMSHLLITAATSIELAYLCRELRPEPLDIPVMPAWRGKSPSGLSTLTLAVTGIGKVNTAWKTTLLLERYLGKRPACIINTGCCGAYPGSGLEIGDLAAATSDLYGDEGVQTPHGWLSMAAIDLPTMRHKGIRYFNEFPLSLERCEKAMRLAAKLGIPMKRGRFVTLSTCSGTTERGIELAGRFNAIAENMEGAAVAQLAIAGDIPCMEIRGVSNQVEDRDLSRWNIPLAVETAQRFLLRYLEQLEEVAP